MTIGIPAAASDRSTGKRIGLWTVRQTDKEIGLSIVRQTAKEIGLSIVRQTDKEIGLSIVHWIAKEIDPWIVPVAVGRDLSGILAVVIGAVAAGTFVTIAPIQVAVEAGDIVRIPVADIITSSGTRIPVVGRIRSGSRDSCPRNRSFRRSRLSTTATWRFRRKDLDSYVRPRLISLPSRVMFS